MQLLVATAKCQKLVCTFGQLTRRITHSGCTTSNYTMKTYKLTEKIQWRHAELEALLWMCLLRFDIVKLVYTICHSLYCIFVVLRTCTCCEFIVKSMWIVSFLSIWFRIFDIWAINFAKRKCVSCEIAEIQLKCTHYCMASTNIWYKKMNTAY